MIGERVLWREGGRDSYLYQNMLINQRLRWFYYLKKQPKIKQVIIATKDNSLGFAAASL